MSANRFFKTKAIKKWSKHRETYGYVFLATVFHLLLLVLFSLVCISTCVLPNLIVGSQCKNSQTKLRALQNVIKCPLPPNDTNTYFQQKQDCQIMAGTCGQSRVFPRTTASKHNSFQNYSWP